MMEQKTLTLSERDWDIVEMALEIAIGQAEGYGTQEAVDRYKEILQAVEGRQSIHGKEQIRGNASASSGVSKS